MKDLSKRLFWRCWKQLVKKPKREIRHPLFGSSIAIDRACGRMSREGALDVRESRERRDKIVPIFLPVKNKNAILAWNFPRFSQDRLLLFARVENSRSRVIDVTDFPTKTAKKEEYFFHIWDYFQKWVRIPYWNFHCFGRGKTNLFWGGGVITSKLASQWPFWGICKHAPPVFWRKRHLLYWKNGGQTKGLSWRGELVHIGLNWSLMLCKRVAHSPWTSPRWLSPPSYPNPLDWVLTRWFGRELPHFGGVTPTCLRVVVSVVRPSFTIYFYMYFYFIQAGRPKKSFLFGPFFFNITNVFCAKKWVGHACICPRMVTG